MKKTIRTLGLLAALAGLSIGTVLAHGDEKHDDHGSKAANEVTLKGEVVDLHCYMMHPENATGMGHAKCAEMCFNKGLPVGFLAEDGTLYLLLGAGHDSPKKQVSGHAGKQVTLTGTLVEHHGMKAIQISSIEGKKSSGKKEGSHKNDHGGHHGHKH